MIKINKSWYIDSDKYSYILFKKAKRISKKTGEEVVANVNVTYHQTVSDALTCLCRTLQKKLTNKNEMSLKEAIEEFEKIEKVVIESANGKKI